MILVQEMKTKKKMKMNPTKVVQIVIQMKKRKDLEKRKIEINYFINQQNLKNPY